MKKSSEKKILGFFLLFLTALIWGVAFVAQSVGMDHIGPYTFNTGRLLLGALVTMPWAIMELKKQKNVEEEKEVYIRKRNSSVIGAAFCAVVFFLAVNLQQFALIGSSVANVSFITTLYILIIPIIGMFLGKKHGLSIWIAIAIAVVGMYLLCIKEGLVLEMGDILAFICAVMFALQILIVDHYVPKSYVIVLSCTQNLFAGLISFVFMLIFEGVNLEGIKTAWLPLAYTGILSTGLAYTTQMLGQKYLKPTVASLIMSLESVIAAIAAWLIIGQALSLREMLGCALVFVGVIIAQIN
jgi:permease, DMT superfamily